MLFDPAADAYYKISARSLEIISRIDRSYTITDFLEKLKACGLHADKDEVMQLIAFLFQSNLVAPEYGQMERKYAQYVKMRDETMFLRFTSAYLFLKLPPVRPEKLFQKITPYVSWLASKYFVISLLIPALIGYVLLARNFSEVRATFLDSLSWAGLAKYFLAIVLMKVVHEAAHSIAAMHFNCRVRGIGLGFMVFCPRLFTDTTDSWRLPRRKRLLIDAAGIIIELLVGGIAALIWVYSPPGAWKSTMFYLFAVSTISTLFVNGNPCIRYDGYYILCDLINIENLMTRSSEYFKQAWRWYFLRLGSSPKEEHGFFLLIFGIVSFIYRIFLYTSIIIVIYNQFVKSIALVLLVLELYSTFIFPMYREFKTIRALSKKSANKARLYLMLALIALVMGVLFIPLSWNIHLVGEIVPLSQSQIAVLESGYLKEALPDRPVELSEKDPVFHLDSPFLDFGIARNRGEYEYVSRMYDLQLSDKNTLGAALVSRQKLRTNQDNYFELERRRLYLMSDAPHDGIFIPRMPGKISAGMFLPKGALVGEIISEKKQVYAYADDRDVPKIKAGDVVRIYVRDSLMEYTGKITTVNSVPAKLRNSPLLQQFGGPIPVYMDEKRPGEFISVLPLYRIEIHFDEEIPFQNGRNVFVEIIHAERMYDTLKKYVLSVIRREF